jgi:DNA-binding PadR family transcriptional regulator
VRRGWIREAILALLAERPMHGYEMISELAMRTGNTWRPSPGSVYPTLQSLEDEGLISAEAEGGKRSYALTETGRRAAAAFPDQPPPWEGLGRAPDTGQEDLRRAADLLLGAVGQVVLAGTAEQKVLATQVLTRARRALYATLADDSTDLPDGPGVSSPQPQ